MWDHNNATSAPGTTCWRGGRPVRPLQQLRRATNLVNLGGGPATTATRRITAPLHRRHQPGLSKSFGDTPPTLLIEPGRYIVADAGVPHRSRARSQRGLTRTLGLHRLRPFRRPRGNSRRSHPLPDTHSSRPRTRRTCRSRRADLRLRRHPLRQDRLPPAARPHHRRPPRHPRGRCLHHHLRQHRLQRLRTPHRVLHLNDRSLSRDARRSAAARET